MITYAGLVCVQAGMCSSLVSRGRAHDSAMIHHLGILHAAICVCCLEIAFLDTVIAVRHVVCAAVLLCSSQRTRGAPVGFSAGCRVLHTQHMSCCLPREPVVSATAGGNCLP
jgi:hypothetical protein